MRIAYFFTLSFIVINCYAQVKFEEVTFTHLPEVVRLPYNSMDAKVADIDNDGDLDIIIAVEFFKNIILLNDSKGMFSDGSYLLPDKIEELSPKPYKYYPYHDSEDIAVVDFNKDSLLDLVFVTEDDRKNEWYLQKKNERFEDVSSKFPVAAVSNAIASGDINGDGWVDLMSHSGRKSLAFRRRL